MVTAQTDLNPCGVLGILYPPTAMSTIGSSRGSTCSAGSCNMKES